MMYLVRLQGPRLNWHREWESRLVTKSESSVNHPFILFNWGTWVRDNNGNQICCLWEELEELSDD